MATPSTAVTLKAIGRFALQSATFVTLPVGQVVQVESTATDASGLPSGHHVLLSSSNTGVAKVTTAHEIGGAPGGVIGIGPGTATITGAAADNSGATATIAITVV